MNTTDVNKTNKTNKQTEKQTNKQTNLGQFEFCVFTQQLCPLHNQLLQLTPLDLSPHHDTNFDHFSADSFSLEQQ
jgi:hypothetical protein